MALDHKRLLQTLLKRYGGAEPEALKDVLCPALIPIHTLDKQIIKLPKQSHYRASFTILITDTNRQLMQLGRTGKFVPKEYVDGGVWREIAKGRVIALNFEKRLASGEVYIGGNKAALEQALTQLSTGDYLEVDQYGASAKVLSGLVEYYLSRMVSGQGYRVRRMPEDVARHVGAYYYYDYEFEKRGVVKKVEVKSLWGTNTKYARLIHSKTDGYPTSSCRFDTQDIFAVSLFLRTGNIGDFAFARSVPKDVRSYGLPRAAAYPDHVHQNPVCRVGDGTWFASIDDVWLLP